MLRTSKGVIEALGDTTAVATLLGLASPVVSNWKARGSIPAEYFVALSDALAEIEMVAHPAVFGMKVPNEAGAGQSG